MTRGQDGSWGNDKIGSSLGVLDCVSSHRSLVMYIHLSSIFPLSPNPELQWRSLLQKYCGVFMILDFTWICFLTQLQISMSLRQVPHRAWQHVAINGLFLVEIAHQEQIIYNNILSHPKRRLPRWLEHTSLSVCIHVGWTRIVWKKQFWERTAQSIFFIRKKDIFNY